MAGKNQIGYNDFFNDSSRDIITTAIKDLRDLRDSYKDFIQFVSGNQIAANNAALAQLAKEVEGVANATKTLNITNESGQKALVENLKAMEKLRAETEGLKAAKAGAQQTEKALAGSVDFLTNSYKEQLKAFRAMGVANEADRQQRERAAATIRETRKEINLLNEATKTTTKIVQYAKGSYGELNAQTKQYEAQIKRLGGAFDGTNPKVAELQAKIHANTEQLKKFDSQMNQNFRNVGNYKSAFNGLGNSVNQISRELPAFANSVQTGFLAISNNLPILADEITNLKNRNAQLRAEGQPTQSLFKSLAGAIFSWGTALSLGVTLLTVYGKDIVKFIGHLFNAAEALDKVKVKQELLNGINKEANETAGKQLVTLQILYSAATNLNNSYKDRLDAVKALKKEFPDTYANLTAEQIMTGKAAKANEDLKTSILEVAKAEAARGKLSALATERLDIDVQKSKINTATNNEKGRVKGDIKLADITTGGFGDKNERAVERSGKQVITVAEQIATIEQRRLKGLAEEDKKLQEIGFKEKVILDFVNSKALVQSITNHDKKKEGETLDELIRKQDELLKAAQEYEIVQAELRFSKSGGSFGDEKKLENERLAIVQKYGALRVGIWKGHNKEILEINKETTEAQARNLEKLKDIEKRRVAESDRDFQETAKNEVAKVQLVYESSSKQFSDQQAFESAKLAILNKSFDDRLALYSADSDEYRNILTQKLEAEKTYSAVLLSIQEGRYEAEARVAASKNAKSNSAATNGIRLRVAKGDISKDEGEDQEYRSRLLGYQLAIGAAKDAQKQMLEGDKDYLDKKKEIIDLEKAYEDEKAEHAIKAAEKVSERKKALEQAAFDFAVTAGGQLFDLGRQLNEQNVARLEADKEKELAIAGNNAAAKAAIEENFQKRIIALKRKQAVYDKIQALFDIGLNTAMAISKATAASPLTFGQPWVTYAIIQGGIQAAAVLAKPLPKYAKGRKGGKAEFAEVNEQGTELLEKNGRLRIANDGKPGVTFLEAGEKVHTAKESKSLVENAIGAEASNKFMQSLLSGTGVVMNYEKNRAQAALSANGISEESLVSAFSKSVEKLPIASFEVSEKGLQRFTKTRSGRIEHLNSKNTTGGNG